MARLHTLLVTLLLSVVGCGCLSTSAAQDRQASAATRPTQVIVTITDRPGRYVAGLNKDQVTILDNGVAQQVLTMEESTFPVSIGLLFNISRSRYRDSLAVARKTILNFFDVPQRTNEYFFMAFDENGIFTTDWTREPKELISGFDKLQSVKPSQSVTTYDALEAVIKKMGDTSHAKRAVIMISDLNDPGPTPKRDQVLEMLKRSKVLVYAIVVDTGLLPRSSVRPALDRICSLSGGFAKDARNTAEFLDLMEIISLELRHQYLISFIPSGSAGDWHRLSFAVKPLTSSSKKIEKVPLFIRGREGYYVTQ